MPRTEFYQLRLTKNEKAELALQAGNQGLSIAQMIRRDYALDPKPSEISGDALQKVVKATRVSEEIGRLKSADLRAADLEFKALVAKNHRRMGLRAAEGQAKQELQDAPR